MTKQHIEKYLSRKPVRIDEYNWFYSVSKGILLVHEVRDHDGDYIRTDQVEIPWRKVQKAVEEYIKAKTI